MSNRVVVQPVKGQGEPCLVSGCQWGSSGTAGGWGSPACDFLAPRKTPPPGCLGAWVTDEDSEAPLDAPYAEWAKSQIEEVPGADS
jgi:hypothetical protein